MSPPDKMYQIKASALAAIEIAPGIYLFRLAAPEIAAAARPGQFVMVRCGQETILPRPISLHTAGSGEIALLVQVTGKGTAWLSQLKKGDTLDIFGPLGNGYYLDPKAKNVLLVAGGMGIAPLRFMAEAAGRAGKKVIIINGARTASLLIPLNPPQDMYNNGMLPASFITFNATEDGTEGFKGLATQLVPHYIKGVDQVFACGPSPMYRAMSRLPSLQGVPVQLSLEIMMGCGTGVCYGCTIKTRAGLKQVCQDGPVFLMDELVF